VRTSSLTKPRMRFCQSVAMPPVNLETLSVQWSITLSIWSSRAVSCLSLGGHPDPAIRGHLKSGQRK
jgi:hypothetical protein